MINRIIEWSSKNRFIVLCLTLFGIAWGWWSLRNIPLDAIPDLSDAQVIVFTEWPGRSPDLVEDQITYPIISSMVAAPRVRVARGYSMFGTSFVYVIFEDGTDMYWARSRTLEYLNEILGKLPEGVRPQLGPDATGVGWIFEYALVDESGKNDLSQLRSFQDWYLRYWLESVPGVSEVASVGGFVKQYQVEVQPEALAAYRVSLGEVIRAIQNSNADVGARLLEMAGTEYAIRGRGYFKSISDIENVAVKSGVAGQPILVKHLGRVHLGGDIRRGAAELDGKGEVIGGIVVMRLGENALKVIREVKKKLEEIRPSLPEGAKIVTTYDRSSLIERAIATLKEKLVEEIFIVSLIIVLFLWHLRAALIAIFTLPVAVLFSFIPMFHLGISSNIMSLGGIAIAIGAMVDAAVILVENAHKKLETWEATGKKEPLGEVLLAASQEVGRPIFFSLVIIAVSFLPIFALEAQEGRLFKPLAFTKNFSMFFAALLAITLVPLLIQLFLRSPKKILLEENHPVSRFLFKIYTPALEFVLGAKKLTLGIAAGLVATIVPVFLFLGSEFMPPLNEGDILYMPTTLPGISIEEAKRWLQIQDQILKTFPEVERVFGKVGRAETSTDPAPLSMVETVVKLKPMREWKTGRSWEELVEAMDQALQLPGTTNAWIMPIKTRIDMLTTGIRTPVGIKIFGPDLKKIEEIGERLEQLLVAVDGTRSVYAERATGGYYIDFYIRRDQIARYGLTVGEVEEVLETAIGGKNITTTVEGRERYPVNVRYFRERRDDLEDLKRVLVRTNEGATIPIAQLADLRVSPGPAMIKNEDGMLAALVYVDLKEGQDVGSYVDKVKDLITKELRLPAGYSLVWSGQFEYMERAKAKLKIVIPVTLLVIFLLLYLNTRSFTKTMIVLLAIPFSLVGAFWFLLLLGYNMSVATWVGVIALAGVDAETGVVMLLYLDLAYEQAQKVGKMRNWRDLKEAIFHGAARRLRPKVMTVACLFMGLLPIMWSTAAQTGADVMKRIAAPMVGGIFTSFLMELLVYPVIYALWRRRRLPA